MFKLEAGQTVKLNYDLEIEDESGYIAIIAAGTEITVKDVCTYDSLTPAEYLAEYGHYNVDVAVDATIINPWDRSGQSDSEASFTTNLDIEEKDLAL
jgi:hypothetical protein